MDRCCKNIHLSSFFYAQEGLGAIREEPSSPACSMVGTELIRNPRKWIKETWLVPAYLATF